MGYQLDKRDMDFLKFAYKALFYDCSKMLIMFLFALATHRGTACLLDLFLLAGLRSNHGGIHLKHYWSCFALSFAVLIFSFSMPCTYAICTLTFLPGCTNSQQWGHAVRDWNLQNQNPKETTDYKLIVIGNSVQQWMMTCSRWELKVVN